MALYRRDPFANKRTLEEGEQIPVTGSEASVVIIDDQAVTAYSGAKVY